MGLINYKLSLIVNLEIRVIYCLKLFSSNHSIYTNFLWLLLSTILFSFIEGKYLDKKEI